MAAERAKLLSGKVAVLAGATDGIGYAIADRLARDGAKLMVSSRKQSNVDRAVDSLREQYGNESVSGVVCHVGKDEDRKNLIQKTMDKFGHIDILVDNAAVNPSTALRKTAEVTKDEWIKIFDVNVISAALLVKEALPFLKERGGSVLFVSSIAAYYPIDAYGISKLAMTGLTRSLARELAFDNIRVNSIAPGMIKTKFGEKTWGDETIKSFMLTIQFIKRIGVPEDCAAAAALLCSDEASFITGETIEIAGFAARL